MNITTLNTVALTDQDAIITALRGAFPANAPTFAMGAIVSIEVLLDRYGEPLLGADVVEGQLCIVVGLQLRFDPSTFLTLNEVVEVATYDVAGFKTVRHFSPDHLRRVA